MADEDSFEMTGTPLDSFNYAKAIAGTTPNRASGELRDNNALAQREPFTFGSSLDSLLLGSAQRLTNNPAKYLIRFEVNLLIPDKEAANIPQILGQEYGDFHSVDFVVGEQDNYGRIPVHAAITRIVFGWLTPVQGRYSVNPLPTGYIG